MTFEQIAAKLDDDLRRAIPLWDYLDRVACVGNGGHESGGFQILQEIAPTVKGSRGGTGYFQWTGPRRRAFEAWCAKRSYDPASYIANSGFLIYELQTSEKGAVGNTRRAVGLEAKVKAFELAYERAGVKHYDSRIKWARKALAVIGNGQADDEPDEVKALEPKQPKGLAMSTTIWAQIGAVLTSVGAGAAQVFGAIDWKVAAVITAGGVAAFAIYTISERLRHARENGV